MKICGWIGSFCFCICSLPELYYSIVNGQCLLSWPFLVLWGLGEIFVLIPVIYEKNELFLIFNYLFSLLCVILLIGIKLLT